MPWTPLVNVIDARLFRDNLIAYFQANQVEALKWANFNVALPSIADFHKSPRLVTRFPAMTFLQIEHKAQWETLLDGDLSITLETALIHGNKDTLSGRATRYSMAIESMIVNVPETTFNANSIITIESTGMGVETVFAVQGKYKNQYIEVFQTKASWHIEASAFAS